MNKPLLSIAMLMFCILTACAEVPLNKQTPSGKPERLFKNAQLTDIKSKVMDRCSNRGNEVEARSNTILCTKTITGGAGVLAQFMVGNSYSTAAVQKVSFLLIQKEKDVLVRLNNIWLESQMAFGQTRKRDMHTNELYNNIQAFLDAI